MSFTVTPCPDRDLWDAQVNGAGGHPLQLWGWGETKAAHSWTVDRVLVRRGGGSDAKGEIVGSAQILLRKLPVPFGSLAYIPRGPQCSEPGAVFELGACLADYVKRTHGSVALSVEPDWPVPNSDSGSGWQQEARSAGWRPGSTVLIPRTLILDLEQSAEDLQAKMSKTTRQNIRKSFKKDVSFREVKSEDELSAVLDVYRQTAQRAGFGLHSDEYYRDIFTNLGAASPVLAAFDAEGPVAFVWLAQSAGTAFELYGGVNERGQKLRVNYGLKWYAIETMKERGVARYDFNGLLNDGISDFKKQFAKHENLLVGTWDQPLSPWYPVFAKALPLARKAVQKGVPLVRGAHTKAAALVRSARRG